MTQVADAPEESETPPPKMVRLGKVNTLRSARLALVRVTEAVLAGTIEPKVANSAIYGLSSIGRILEFEVLERRIKALEQGQPLLTDRDQRASRLYGHA